MNEARVDECNQHLIYRVGASLIWSFGSWSERKVFMERWMESETPSSTFSFSVLRSFCLFSSVSSPALIAVKTDWTESVRLMDDYYYYCRIQSFLFFIVLIGKCFMWLVPERGVLFECLLCSSAVEHDAESLWAPSQSFSPQTEILNLLLWHFFTGFMEILLLCFSVLLSRETSFVLAVGK